MLDILNRIKHTLFKPLYRKSSHFEKMLQTIQYMQIDANKEKIFTFNHYFDGLKYENTKNIIMYLPHALTDWIQSNIVKTNDFYSIQTIEKVDKYFNDGACILDIGANIGNHSLYYAMVRKAKKVYAFEPIKETYANLCKNIELNALQNIIIPHNIALGEKTGRASIKNAPFYNIGGISLQNNKNGDLKIVSLDEMQESGAFANKIDFVKIDVEGFEAQVLRGGDNS